jgi:putative peptidoglycan lipid II flippase
MLMPQAAIAQSAAIAALPTFSAQAALGKLDEMRASLAATLRGVLLLAIPATVGLVVLRKPVVALIYEHGEFTSASTELVAWALLWYTLGLVWHSVLEVISRAFYALHDTKTPVVVGVAAMSLNLIFSLLFSELFRQAGWAPHGGLALANSLATLLETCALLYLMRRRLNGLQGGRILKAVGQGGLGALGMGAALFAWLAAAAPLGAALLGLGGVALGAGVYLALLALLRVGELQMVWAMARSRLLRKG